MDRNQEQKNSEAVRNALNERLARNLRPVLAGSGFLYLVLTFGHLWSLPPATAGSMAWASSLSAVTLLALWWLLKSHPVAPRQAHLFASLVAGIILLNCQLHLLLSGQAWQTTNSLLLLLGISVLFLSRPWFLLAAGSTVGSWALVALQRHDDPLWPHFAFAFFMAIILALVINTIQIRTLTQVERLRLQLEHTVLDQTEELRTTNDDLVRSSAALQVQAARLATLNRMGHAVTSSLTRDALVSNCLAEFASALRPDLALFFTRERGVLRLEGHQEAEPRTLGGQIPTHQVGECLCGLAVLKRAPIFSRNIHSDTRCTWEECKRAGYTSFAAIPLIGDAEVIGVLGLGSKAERDFALESDFIEALAGTVATGLKNALLYDRLREKSTELEASVQEYRRSETERKSLQSQLIHAQKMEAIATLSGGIAHDFNNILAAIIGYAELAQSEVEYGSSLAQDLDEILRSAGRAADLVRQILTFSRPDERQERPVEFGLIVKEAAKFARASLPSSIQIEQKVRSRAVVQADPTHLHQLVMNLCTNAAQAMQNRGGTLTIELTEVDLTPEFVSDYPNAAPGQHLKLVVRDTGYGIREEWIGRIFDPYFTTKEPGEGTGLGLAVVHGIVTGCNGIITVSSRDDEGTTFTVYLPTIELPPMREPIPAGQLPTGSARLLLVEDEAMLRKATETLLSRLGYQVTSCSNGQEALTLFKATPQAFDLVISDLTMPKVRGDELALELHRLRPDLPVILCTGYGHPVLGDAELAQVVTAFLPKPIQIAQWAVTIREALSAGPPRSASTDPEA